MRMLVDFANPHTDRAASYDRPVEFAFIADDSGMWLPMGATTSTPLHALTGEAPLYMVGPHKHMFSTLAIGRSVRAEGEVL